MSWSDECFEWIDYVDPKTEQVVYDDLDSYEAEARGMVRVCGPCAKAVRIYGGSHHYVVDDDDPDLEGPV
jgi:hypothetical protein